MKNNIKIVLDEEVWASGNDNDIIAAKIVENIKFDLMEYTNYLNEKYKPFAGDWIRISDDKIIYNCGEIVDEFLKIQNEKSN